MDRAVDVPIAVPLAGQPVVQPSRQQPAPARPPSSACSSPRWPGLRLRATFTDVAVPGPGVGFRACRHQAGRGRVDPAAEERTLSCHSRRRPGARLVTASEAATCPASINPGRSQWVWAAAPPSRGLIPVVTQDLAISSPEAGKVPFRCQAVMATLATAPARTARPSEAGRLRGMTLERPNRSNNPCSRNRTRSPQNAPPTSRSRHGRQ